MTPEDFRGAFPRRDVRMASMRLLAVVGLLALALLLSGCDDGPTAPRPTLCPDTTWTDVPMVHTTTGDTVWVRLGVLVCMKP